jgi:Planctomycete cytochrome C
MLKRNILFVLGAVILFFSQCVHEPVIPTGDGNPPKTGTCDPDTVYFQNDILPLLSSNCAGTNCHDTKSAQGGVILDNYDNIITTGEIKPGQPTDNSIYETVTSSDSNTLMPPPATGLVFNQDQIDMITKWISQGALNNACDETGGICDSLNMSFKDDIFPLMKKSCVGCHSGTKPQGGIDLSTYNNIFLYVNSGSLLGSIERKPGYVAMPYKQQKWNDCYIAMVRNWILEGAQDN